MAQTDQESTRPDQSATKERKREFTAAEIGAIAHLYRGEIYRSTVWRTRLDTTTNWSVVTTGIAFTASFSSATASPLPLLLVSLLVSGFLMFEARRYRYFAVWRARARHMETEFYVPVLLGESIYDDDTWREILAEDYSEPRHYISFARAYGRRLRLNYVWLLGIQGLAYFGKLAIHPTALAHWSHVFPRAALGPVPGMAVIAVAIVFHLGWIVFAYATYRLERRDRKLRRSTVTMG